MPLAKIIDLILGSSQKPKLIKHASINSQPSTSSFTEKRLCPRIKYPLDTAPSIQFDGQEFKVADLSKTGVKFMLAKSDCIGTSLISGSIKISDRSRINFRGATIRQDPEAGFAVIQFTQTEYFK